MRKFLICLLLCITISYAQKENNTLNIGGVLGNVFEGGDVGSEGFNPCFDLFISKHVTSQVALSTNIMLGSVSGQGKSVQEFHANFHALSANLVYHLIQLDNTALYMKGGVGLLGFSGDRDGIEYDQNIFSQDGFIIPTGMGLKYRFSQNIQGVLDYSSFITIGPGLDGIERANESGMDFGFRTLTIGVAYTFGETDPEYAEWANPIDIVYNQMKDVEKEVLGLSIDTDGDGVADKFDKENNTPAGVAVDGSGKSLDVDSDGVPDYKDLDPFTSPGVSVDSNGQELDDDKDGVPNSMDEEPNSPVGCTVNFQGRQIVGKGAFLPTVYFDVASSEVTYSNYQRLATVASVLKANPGYKLRVIGFADSVGSTEANYQLGLTRANAVIESLVNTFGIDINRMIADSQGENNLLANEEQQVKVKVSSDGLSQTTNFRSLNRRVQFIIE